MKLLLFADPHWCTYSSIVRSRGIKFSTRLENLINSVNWVEEIAKNIQVDKVISLGDFFDSNELDSESITALDQIKWANIPHMFIVGNHEIGRGNAEFSSSHLFTLNDSFQVIDQPTCFDCGDGTELFFLPYILETNRKPILEYFNFKDLKQNQNILFMHNDIKGIQMGKFISKDGFEINEIETHFNLCVNGHIHNFSQVSDKIINLGNLTGQNFSEDAWKYNHFAMCIDTSNHSINYYQNPFAFNFYKFDLTNYSEKKITNVLTQLSNAVITVKCNIDNVLYIKNLLENSQNVIEYRVIIELSDDSTYDSVISQTNFSIDHLVKFREYVKENLGTSDELIDELKKITGAIS